MELFLGGCLQTLVRARARAEHTCHQQFRRTVSVQPESLERQPLEFEKSSIVGEREIKWVVVE